MENQKIINLLDNTQNEPSKLRTRNLKEINDESRGAYDKDNQIKFKTSMIRPNSCDYSNAYVLVSGTGIITGEGDDDAANQLDERNKGVIFKICGPFTECVSNINNTQIDNARDTDIVMPMYNLIEYSDNYSKTSGNLWQYYRYYLNDNMAESESFKSKITIIKPPLIVIQKVLKQ